MVVGGLHTPMDAGSYIMAPGRTASTVGQSPDVLRRHGHKRLFHLDYNRGRRFHGAPRLPPSTACPAVFVQSLSQSARSRLLCLSAPVRDKARHLQGWSDVYYFCGDHLQYCTCDFRWNGHGYMRAAILASFVLSTATALQKVIIHYAFDGLLPGESPTPAQAALRLCTCPGPNPSQSLVTVTPPPAQHGAGGGGASTMATRLCAAALLWFMV